MTPLKHTSTEMEAPTQMHLAFEWPTWLVLGTFWLAWLSLVFTPAFHSQSSWLTHLALTACLSVLLAWYMSIQHELVHGHPTRSRKLNRLLGLAPFAIWFPYDLYVETHLKHHNDEDLTLPGVDPESNYVLQNEWTTLGKAGRFAAFSRRTVLGRLLLCPALVIADLLKAAWEALSGKENPHKTMWALHLALVAILLLVIHFLSRWSVWVYLLAAYLGFGLAMLRSFYEHRQAAQPCARTVINEASWFWRLLYLNNNYHAVHHHCPKLAWYWIPKQYKNHKDVYLARNDGFLLRGYVPLIWRNAIRKIDHPLYQELGDPRA